jgi:hypothetical protein
MKQPNLSDKLVWIMKNAPQIRQCLIRDLINESFRTYRNEQRKARKRA